MRGDTLIWDVDGTLYPLSAEMDARCLAAAAKAARQLGYRGTHEEAEALARQCFLQRNNGLEVFTQGEIPLAMHDLHRVYHEHIAIDDMPPYRRLAAFMGRTPHTHAALTHGSADWARRVIAQRGLTHFFDPHHIVGLEDCGFQTKHESEASFRLLLKRLGKEPSQCIMIEDSARNLRIPYEMGMETVLVNRLLDDPPPYVMHQFRTPEALMQQLHREQLTMSGRRR